MGFAYTLNCGQYVLTEDGRPIGRVLDEVSIALDLESHTLHKHGAPEMVQAWIDKTQAKMRSAGFDEMASQIVSITGRFRLEDLNRCLDTSGYAGHLYSKALAGELLQLPYAAKPDEVPAVAAAAPSSSRRMRF